MELRDIVWGKEYRHMADLERLEDIRRRFEARLMDTEGVISVGIGQGPDGKPCILIGTSVPTKQIMDKLPAELLGQAEVRLEYIGEIEAQG